MVVTEPAVRRCHKPAAQAQRDRRYLRAVRSERVDGLAAVHRRLAGQLQVPARHRAARHPPAQRALRLACAHRARHSTTPPRRGAAPARITSPRARCWTATPRGAAPVYPNGPAPGALGRRRRLAPAPVPATSARRAAIPPAARWRRHARPQPRALLDESRAVGRAPVGSRHRRRGARSCFTWRRDWRSCSSEQTREQKPRAHRAPRGPAAPFRTWRWAPAARARAPCSPRTRTTPRAPTPAASLAGSRPRCRPARARQPITLGLSLSWLAQADTRAACRMWHLAVR